MKKKIKIVPIIIFFCFYLIFQIFKLIKSSHIFRKSERLNIVFYNENSHFYSLGLKDDVNYFISFYPDLQVVVPGGYKYYRLGALGKLVGLENKNELIKKTFSLATSNFIDLYFYPTKQSIYYGKDITQRIKLPKLTDFFSYKSNANFIDRIYLVFLFYGKNQLKFIQIDDLPIGKNSQFIASEFAKKNQGSFYKRSYRKENSTVQIIYTKSYKTAVILSQILEGEGIRVSDLTEGTANDNTCIVYDNKKNFSLTSQNLSDFFHCSIKSASTGGYDIIFKLGNREGEWEVD